MIFITRGRLTEAPKPPQTQPMRRNFMVAVDIDHPEKARQSTLDLLEKSGYTFISVMQVYRVNDTGSDEAIRQIVDLARRDGIGVAIYR